MKKGIFVFLLLAFKVYAISTDVHQLKLRDSHLIFDDKLGAREVAITFAGKIDETLLEKIIEILDKENIKAHFFINGDSAILYPKLVYKLLSKKHIVGSQGLTTPFVNNGIADKQAILKEIQYAHELLFLTTGVVYPFIRLSPRQGGIATRDMIKESGAFAFYWNIDYYPENPDQSMRDNLKRENYRGIIALPLAKGSNLIALNALIDEIKKQDLTVITIIPHEESTWLDSPPLIRKSVKDQVHKDGSLLYQNYKEESDGTI